MRARMMSQRRVSGTHGARLDDQLKREVDPLVHGKRGSARPEEDPEREGIPENEPEVALARNPVFARREISRHLRPSIFPADREELRAEAERSDAPEHVRDLIAQLPASVTFRTVYEVWDAVGGEREPQPHGRPQRIRKSA
jgi:Protein of unknown function (DUF2795)